MHCLLFAGTKKPAQPAAPGTTRIFFDAWDVDAGDLSLRRIMTEELSDLRREHAAWAYETGLASVDGQTVAGILRAGSPLSMWWCSILYERHPKVSPALYTVYRLRTLERLLVRLQTTSLEVHGLDPVCVQVLRRLCREHNWQFQSADEASPKSLSPIRRLYNACPAPLRALTRLLVWLVQVKRLLKSATLAPCSTQTGTIATYFPNISLDEAQKGLFRSKYWESLHTALEEAAPRGMPAAVRWLFIRFPSPQATLEQCCALKEEFQAAGKSGVSFNYLEEFLTGGDMLAACRRYVRLALASFRVQKALRPLFFLEGSRLDLWPLLAADYVESFRGWRCLERCLQQQGLENYVQAAGPQRWYTFPMENCPWERMLTHAVHRMQAGPVYGAQHSTIRPTDFRYFDDPRTFANAETALFQPDLVAGNGESACSQWRASGVPADRLGKIEALRYLYLSRYLHSSTGFADNILVVTSFFADETDAHLELLCQCLKEKILRPEQITVKPHPYLPVEERLQALLGDESRRLRISVQSMPDELASSPIVWASNSTTAVLEAALMGLPVLVMQPAGDFDLCPLQDIAELQRTSDVASVREALAHLAPLPISDDYLCLNLNLTRWRRLLQLSDSEV